MPHATSTGSAFVPACIRKWLPSMNRYSSSISERSADLNRSNSSLMASQILATVERDTVASGPRASPRVASTSRTDRPRTNPAITSDSNALVLVTPAPSRREAKAMSVPRSLGRSREIGPAVDFTVNGAKPLREPARAASVNRRRSKAREKHPVGAVSPDLVQPPGLVGSLDLVDDPASVRRQEAEGG